MKTLLKYTAYVCAACLAAVLLYVLCIRGYVALKFSSEPLLSEPVSTHLYAQQNDIQVPLVWLHKVNTPARAACKE